MSTYIGPGRPEDKAETARWEADKDDGIDINNVRMQEIRDFRKDERDRQRRGALQRIAEWWRAH